MAQSHAPVAPGLTSLEHGIVDIFVRLADMLGLPKTVGEIYGLLFASAQPLAFQDIADRLEISKGSVSQGLRLLHATGAIKLVYIAGNRRDYFIPETEMRALLAGILREKVQPQLENGALRIKALQALARTSDLGAKDPAAAEILGERIAKLNSWHKKGKAIVPLVTKFF